MSDKDDPDADVKYAISSLFVLIVFAFLCFGFALLYMADHAAGRVT